MSAYIVLGTDEQLNDLVDGITRCHLLSSEVSAFVSSGVIEEKNNSLFYNFSCYNKGEAIPSKNGFQETRRLRDILANQLAHLRRIAVLENPEASINIFLLTNPHVEKDFDRIKYVIKEIEELDDRTIRLMTVVLSYDLNHCDDVTLRPNKEILVSFMQEYQRSTLPENGDFRKDMLYLNNIDMNNAAIAFDTARLGEILNTFFMLLSNDSDCYHANSSLTGNLFSIGYADYIYNFSDLSRYFILSLQKDFFIEQSAKKEYDPNQLLEEDLSKLNSILSSRWLNISDPLDSLDIRVESMKKVFIEIDYWKDPDSSLYTNSLVKHQNNIILQLKDLIPDHVPYVDWKMIYEAGKGNKGLLSPRDLEIVYELIENYKKLVSYIRTEESIDELLDSYSANSKRLNLQNSQKEEVQKEELSLFKKILRFFGLYKTAQTAIPTNVVTNDNHFNDEMKIRNHIKSFKQSYKLIEQHQHFIESSVKAKDELSRVETELKEFKLTKFEKSIPMIDKEKMSSFYKICAPKILENINSKLPIQKEFETITSYFQDLNKIIQKETLEYIKEWDIIDWDNLAKYEFLKTLDDSSISDVINEIQLISTPYIACDQTDPESLHTSISRKVYCNSSDIVAKIADRKLENIQNLNAIDAAKSRHIENKLCYFQIYNIENITTIYDCRESSKIIKSDLEKSPCGSSKK